ncbi:MAG: CPBP family glutamic-type intramembrane protease [Planctomycetota bacterium]|nr:CPBP family glutamic-type intramembrane protease [Planctomycetota bacterium]
MIATLSCRHCGREQPASANFCAGCGLEFRSTRFGEEAPPPVPSWERRAGLQGRSAIRVVMALLIALAVSIPFAVFSPDTVATWLFIDAMIAGVVIACVVLERGALGPLLKASGGFWLLLAVPAAYVMQGLGWLWMKVLDRSDQILEAEPSEAWLPVWMLLLSIVVVPALFEELAFRGIFLRSARLFLRPLPAHLLTAAAFALIHFQPMVLPFHFAMGLALGGLRAGSGSLWPPILLHAANNALAAGLLPGSPFAP